MSSPLDRLEQFVSDRESFSWRQSGARSFELVSGTWMGFAWKHDVVVVEPHSDFGFRRRSEGEVKVQNPVVLYVTGGDVNDLDLAEAQRIADRSGLSVAMLFHIPNQPLFDLWEDDLIAHTFEQFIDGGDASWPLLFPMTRAVIRAMDMLEETGCDRFVVTGASKRGWATWLAGATGDPRIIGISPMVIDNLNFPAQMAHQIECWGSYSEQIEDYTSRELQDSMDTERGALLTLMMDPINYIDQIKCPILIVNGANDRYWTVDALSIYWDRLPSTTRCLIVPNAGHLLGDKVQMIETLSAFALAAVRGEILPNLGHDWTKSRKIRSWVAFSSTLDFRDSEWLSGTTDPSVPAAGMLEALRRSARDTGMNAAYMVEAVYEGPTGSFSLSTPAAVLRLEESISLPP